MPKFEIVWQSPHGRKFRQTYQHEDIGIARAWAQEFAELDPSFVWEVLAVLPLPTQKQQSDAVLGLMTQIHADWGVQIGNPFDCEVKQDINRSVQDDLFYADERVSTAFFLGFDWLYWQEG